MSRTALAGSVSPTGLGFGLLFWFASLTPTLVPRGWIVQGVTGGVCLAIGYAIGAVAERAMARLTGQGWLGPESRAQRAIAAVMVALAVGVVGALAWATWQNEARDLTGMAHLAWWEGPPMVVLSLAVGRAAIGIGATVETWPRATLRRFERALPGLPVPATLLLAVVISLVGGQVAVRGFAIATVAVYGWLDQGTNPGIHEPTLASVSGSPSSLVRWETMGLWGRDFVAGVTTREQLREYHGAGADVRDPVRVFVGMRTAATLEERVAIAVRDLERAGGFERGVIAVWVPGGSGWMDPDAARALEQLHAGDTAIVATQYSYLPSFFSLVIDSSKATDAGARLFAAVHARWSTMPEADRPRLIVFGASLGSAGAEMPFVGADVEASAANFAREADGALLVGSLGWNPILRQLTDTREAGSPAWQPTHGGGDIVRFLAASGQRDFDIAWGPSRVVYLQHPTDPVTYLSPAALWSPPEWMNEPRGPGVPPATAWFPIVSAVQAMADLSFPASLPSGFGHDYRVDYADAFARVAPPEGWTAEDTARLEAFLGVETLTAGGAP